MVILYKSVGLYKYYHRVEQLESGKLINGLCNEFTTELPTLGRPVNKPKADGVR